MMESDEDDRRAREKFPRERDHKRDDDRYNGGLKRSGSRRDEYNGSKRGRLDSDHDRDDSVLLSFKKFLLTQEDDITDDQAVSKYNEYKVDFSRKILQKFFTTHKDEEWFRQKYHPDDVSKISSAHLESVKKRLEIFDDLRSKGVFETVSLDQEHTQEIIKILDSVVILLEGGNQEDLEALKNEAVEDDSISDVDKQNKEEKEKTESSDEKTDAVASETEEGERKKSACLHKTSSIFIRNIPPNVTTEELEALCKRSPGFLRLALGDAASDKKFSRRAWATYKRDVNIKEICWNINNVRVKEADLSAIINRDLTRRLRTTNGITAHKQVALNDLRIAAKLAAMYDKRLGLYGEEEVPIEERLKDIRMGVDLISSSKNPLVKQAKTVLMDTEAEEISPEEEELLRRSGEDASGGSEEKGVFAREETVLRALDNLVFYLRIVHSADFYGHLDYPNEDNMPSRCGILHVRGQSPNGSQWGTSDDGKVLVSNKFITDFISGFNQRIESHLINTDYITDEDLVKLGKKDGEKEVEIFIETNTVELAKDKWLCPLSGKKFKGPEFIRKHLLTKHEEKLNEVKQEADFFNNYLADPKRPTEPETKSTPTPNREDDRREDRYRSADRSRGPSSRGYGNYGGGGQQQRDGYRSGGRYFEDAGRRDSRPQVSYRDLDAPDDMA